MESGEGRCSAPVKADPGKVVRGGTKPPSQLPFMLGGSEEAGRNGLEIRGVSARGTGRGRTLKSHKTQQAKFHQDEAGVYLFTGEWQRGKKQEWPPWGPEEPLTNEDRGRINKTRMRVK